MNEPWKPTGGSMAKGPKLQMQDANGVKLSDTVKVEASHLTGSVKYLLDFVTAQLKLSGQQRAVIEPAFETLDETIRDKAGEWSQIFLHILEELRQKGIELEQREELLKKMRRDGRTLLYRRELGEEDLLKTLRTEHRGHGFGIEIVDHDQFKHYNDTYGHEFGDLILSITGQLFRMHREGDIGVRWGGDEFLRIVLGLVTGKQLAMIAERDVELINAYPWQTTDERFHQKPRWSIGLVYCEHPSQEERERMKEVDSTLDIKPEQWFDTGISVRGGSTYDLARKLVAVADQNMYKSKREQKGPVQTNFRIVNSELVDIE